MPEISIPRDYHSQIWGGELPGSAAEARALLSEVRSQLVASDGTIRSGYLSLQGGSRPKLENLSRFNVTAHPMAATHFVRQLIDKAYGDMDPASRAHLQGAIEKYLEKSGGKLGTLSFVKLFDALESAATGVPSAGSRSQGARLNIDASRFTFREQELAQRIADLESGFAAAAAPPLAPGGNAASPSLTSIQNDIRRFNDRMALTRQRENVREEFSQHTQSPALDRLMQSINTTKDEIRALADKINADLAAEVDNVAPPSLAPLSLSALRGKIQELEALKSAFAANEGGVIIPQTLRQIDAALERLNGHARLTEPSARQLLDEVQQLTALSGQYLAAGGKGGAALSFAELPGAVAVLRKLDAMLARPEMAVHHEALAAKQTALSQRITDAVETHVDPLSQGALTGKLQRLSAREQLQVAGRLLETVGPSLTRVKDALEASAARGVERAGAEADRIGAMASGGGVHGAIAAVGAAVEGATAAATAAQKALELATQLRSAISEGKVSDAVEAFDALIAMDPGLRTALQGVKNNFLTSLRTEVDAQLAQRDGKAQAAARLEAYGSLVELERSLPEGGPASVDSLRARVIAARDGAFEAVRFGVKAQQATELASAMEGTRDLGRRAAILNTMLSRANREAVGEGPVSAAARAFADTLRPLALEALQGQRAALEARMGGAASLSGAAARAERAAVTAELRSFIRNVDNLDSANPAADLTALRAAVTLLQEKDALSQLGPRARPMVEASTAPVSADGMTLKAAVQRLYAAGVLTLPAFTDKLDLLLGDLLPGDTRSTTLIFDLAKGDAGVIEGFFSDPQWDATALALRKLAVDQGNPPPSVEQIELAHRLMQVKCSLDFVLRANNPSWRADARSRQEAGNALGQNASGLANIQLDQKSVAAILAAGQRMSGPAFDLKSFQLTLARAVHLEGEASGADTAALVGQILGLDPNTQRAEVLAQMQLGESFGSPEDLVALADGLDAFSRGIAGRSSKELVDAMLQSFKNSGDARPEAALLLDRISARSLVRLQAIDPQRIDTLSSAGADGRGLVAGQRLYAAAWIAGTTRLSAENLTSLRGSASLIGRLVTDRRVPETFLNKIASNLAAPTERSLAQRVFSAIRPDSGVFSTYFDVSSTEFRNSGGTVNHAKLNLDTIQHLQNYTNQSVALGDGPQKALQEHVKDLIATLAQSGFEDRTSDLIDRLPAGSPQKEHLSRLISELRAASLSNRDQPGVRREAVEAATRRLEALCALGRSLPNITLYRDQQDAAAPELGALRNLFTPNAATGFVSFPPPSDDSRATDACRSWAQSEITKVERAAPEVMPILTAAILEQFSASSYTDFGKFREALIAGDAALVNELTARLTALGLGNFDASAGAQGGDNQALSMARLSLFAQPDAAHFLTWAEKDLPPMDDQIRQASGVLQSHLQTYAAGATLVARSVRDLLPGQTTEIEVTQSGSLRIKHAIAPGARATAGFSAARSNSLTVTREDSGAYVVVSKSGKSGGISGGISTFSNALSARLSVDGQVAHGAMLEFTPNAGAVDPVERAVALVSGLLSNRGNSAPANILNECRPDRLRCLDQMGMAIGAEAGVEINLGVAGAELTLNVGGELRGERTVTSEANAFQNRRSTQNTYTVAGAATAALGGSSVTATGSLTMTHEHMLVTERGVVVADSFVRTTAAVAVSALGSRSGSDFDSMLGRLSLPPGVDIERFAGTINLMRRLEPASIAVRSQLTPDAATRLAQLRGNPSPSASAILNDPNSYTLTALEFTVPGQSASTNEAHVERLVSRIQARAEAVKSAAERVEQTRDAVRAVDDFVDALPDGARLVLDAGSDAIDNTRAVVEALGEVASGAQELMEEALPVTLSVEIHTNALVESSRVFTLDVRPA